MDIPLEPTEKVTEAGRIRCKFELFVRLYPHVESRFSYGARIWTFRGDKYTDVVNYMLRNLARIVKRDYPLYTYMEIYDNDYPKEDPDFSLLRIVKNKIEKNVLFERYGEAFSKDHWPDWIKKVIHDTPANPPR